MRGSDADDSPAEEGSPAPESDREPRTRPGPDPDSSYERAAFVAPASIERYPPPGTTNPEGAGSREPAEPYMTVDWEKAGPTYDQLIAEAEAALAERPAKRATAPPA